MAMTCDPQTVLAASSNGQVGILSALNLKSRATTPLMTIGGDVELRAFPGHPYLYVIHRDPVNEIEVWDAKTFVRKVRFPVGPNPQDIVPIDDTTAFVSFFSMSEIVKFRITDGQVLSSIRIDGHPRNGILSPGRMLRLGNDLLVQVRRLHYDGTTWVPNDYSEVCVIDIGKENISKRVRLIGRNPMGALSQGYDGGIYVATDVGVERLEPESFEPANHPIYPKSGFPGRAIDVQMVSRNFGYVIWLQVDGKIGLHTFDPMGLGYGAIIALQAQPIQVVVNRESQLLYITYRDEKRTWITVSEASATARPQMEYELPNNVVPTQVAVVPY